MIRLSDMFGYVVLIDKKIAGISDVEEIAEEIATKAIEAYPGSVVSVQCIEKNNLTNLQNKTIFGVGTSLVMNNGEVAIVKNMRNLKDCDIEVNGKLLEGVSYSRFEKRTLSSLTTLEQNVKERIGKKLAMRCGMECEIIAYRAASDIDVRFENGEILEHVNYSTFGTKRLNPPSLIKTKETKEVDYSIIGTEKNMKCGLTAKIISIITPNTGDIQFEDGEIIKNIYLSNFDKGLISHPFLNKTIHNARYVRIFHGYAITRIRPAFIINNEPFYQVILPDGNRAVKTPKDMIENSFGNSFYLKAPTTILIIFFHCRFILIMFLNNGIMATIPRHYSFWNFK